MFKVAERILAVAVVFFFIFLTITKAAPMSPLVFSVTGVILVALYYYLEGYDE